MGKKLVIKGVDFSTNGFRTGNMVNVTIGGEGTNPYALYFLPTAIAADQPKPNDAIVIPNDAVSNVLSADGEVNINTAYQSFLFAQSNALTVLDELIVDYNKSEIDKAVQMFSTMSINKLDMRGVSFARNCNINCMFAGADISELKMPDMYVYQARNAFYNFNNTTNAPADFSFIKEVNWDLTTMFQYLKATTAIFNGIDVSRATIFNSTFRYSVIDEIDLSAWTFESMTHCITMFEHAKARTIHLDNLSKTVGAVYCSNMFNDTPNLVAVFVTNCSAEVKTWLLGLLNGVSAGGSNNWSETTVGGKAALTHS